MKKNSVLLIAILTLASVLVILFMQLKDAGAILQSMVATVVTILTFVTQFVLFVLEVVIIIAGPIFAGVLVQLAFENEIQEWYGRPVPRAVQFTVNILLLGIMMIGWTLLIPALVGLQNTWLSGTHQKGFFNNWPPNSPKFETQPIGWGIWAAITYLFGDWMVKNAK